MQPGNLVGQLYSEFHERRKLLATDRFTASRRRPRKVAVRCRTRRRPRLAVNHFCPERLWIPAALFLIAVITCPCRADFTLTYMIQEPSVLSAVEDELLSAALEQAADLWQGILLGHQSQDVLDVEIQILLTTTGLASAAPKDTVTAGGFTYPTSGRIWLNKDQIIPATDGLGLAAGVNVLDELLSHETAHALGFGTLWRQNGIYESNTGRYLGEAGLEAYRSEFDTQAEWVPVELAGASSSANSHWDQLLRSSSEEGNPADPLSLSPLAGITDRHGRDLALELMTAAIDPDHGEPFLSRTTIQSFRDLGYQVVPEPALCSWGLIIMGFGVIRSRRPVR